MEAILERILNGENPRLVFLEEQGKVRFPVKIKDFNIENLTPVQISKIKENSKRVFKWMQEFIGGSGLDSCGIILELPDDRIYMEITPKAVAFSPNLYHYTLADDVDDETLGLVILNWNAIKEKVKKAAEWLIRNKKENEKNKPESIDDKLANFAL